MDTYKLKFTRLQNEIFRFLCIKSDKSFSQNSISRHLDVSPTAISKSIKLLLDYKLILKREEDNIKLNKIKLNRDNSFVLELKRVENLKQIYESKLVEDLERKFPGSTIILFGSYSRGEDRYNSDIDIAVIYSKKKQIDLKSFEKKLERNININFYDNLKEINNELKSNILNGITLRGGISL